MPARENAVKQLTELYVIVAGLAFANAIRSVVNVDAPDLPFRTDALWLFAAFIVTIIPFHHGAVRYLFSNYVENENHGAIALPIDFLLLFIQAIVLFGLSMLLSKSYFFAWGLLVLLVIDVIWAALALVTCESATAREGARSWLLVNLIAAPILLLLIFVRQTFDESQFIILIATFALLRTIADYGLSWGTYFPPPSKKA